MPKASIGDRAYDMTVKVPLDPSRSSAPPPVRSQMPTSPEVFGGPVTRVTAASAPKLKLMLDDDPTRPIPRTARRCSWIGGGGATLDALDAPCGPRAGADATTARPAFGPEEGTPTA